jgi:hypothetical protein
MCSEVSSLSQVVAITAEAPAHTKREVAGEQVLHRITEKPAFRIAFGILEERWPTLDKRTMEVLARQSIAKPISQTNVRKELSARLTRLVNAQFPHLQAQRNGRSRLVRISPPATRGKEGLGAETHDQTLSRINLDSANSDTNQYIFREHEAAVDNVDQIMRAASSQASIHPAQSAALPALLTRPARSSALTRIMLETVTATYSTMESSPRLIFRALYLRLVEGVTPRATS